ncbi:GNAT family N-acetyltransferase [Rhodospirillaceae bacterium KN72]|uniref:GNAT family N-acetyltransferase n=1 Tax=Pacificispira spongiicola TaxID=2729598 RepID=A0A7Y0E2Z4_9PROT|nr:GNAT family N-acetyltransferase [Pacificispira spongiicola]NMM45541.1 GNAT family N-acetyltransferase [Pacificispira spongiicola]
MRDEKLIFDGYRPGAMAAAITLHMAYYAPQWGFGAPFESKLGREMGEFLGRYDPDRDLFLTAYRPDGTLVGTITLDGVDADTADGVHLRWFIVSEAARGMGLGRQLMATAVEFLDRTGYDRTYLTTFAGLDAARSLYESFGFHLTKEEPTDPWSGSVGLQRFDRITEIRS